jgi:hypothetical protein
MNILTSVQNLAFVNYDGITKTLIFRPRKYKK